MPFFFLPKATFLGYIISSKGNLLDDKKLKANVFDRLLKLSLRSASFMDWPPLTRGLLETLAILLLQGQTP